MRTTIWAAALLLAVCIHLPQVSAQSKPSGVYVRGQLGLGGAKAGTEVFNTDLVFTGGAGFLNLEVGGEVSANLVLFAKLFGVSVEDPDVEYGNYDGEADGNGYFAGIGGGLAHRSPSNLVLSVALSFSRLGFDTDDDDYESDVGAMLHFGISKTWPVSPHVGLGLGLEATLGGFPDDTFDDDDDWDWGAGYLVLAFTASYN